ncbi:hypothetical protein TSUD_289780 [Trifolium subterraneum]|uniref:Reverse transcriptase zinc-binding domain-containing protein n=1 Tax=Trifolium subterraneum TaxID=3900 RepID=A0A2Z6MMF8_TRISU|nr:hypothetical protein TSUD_289780 [Trifolium subterraneum]
MLVEKHNNNNVLRAPLEELFKNLWCCAAPSKVCAFSWQLLLDRIQTRDNLCKRRIIQQHQAARVLCELAAESGLHLFLHCNCNCSDIRLGCGLFYCYACLLGLM